MGEAKYYSMVLMMAERMPMVTKSQRELRAKALEMLLDAVSVEHVERGSCRDRDPHAAVRERARW